MILSTERLMFRRWSEADAPVLYKYASDPEVGSRAGWPPHKSEEESLEIIRTLFNSDSMWAIVLKETGEPIGCIGYMVKGQSNIDLGDNDAEIGYWIARPYWNRGICTEALRWMIDVCFNEKHFHVLWSDYFIDNPASGRVMRKCGFEETGVETTCPNLMEGKDRTVRVTKLEKMRIRNEDPADWQEVENLTREAFWNVYRPGCLEHFVLNRYRSNPDFIPELDFVMEAGGRIIGHVMYSKAELTSAEGDVLPAWTLGPICIHPDWKRKGYGLALLEYSLEKARETGVRILCFEGNIDFYKNAGFVLASSLGIHYHGEPEDDPVPYFLARELDPGYLGGREWTYCPPKGYFVADEDPEGFEKYEAAFPPKEKHFVEGQLPQFCQSCGMPMTADEVCGTNADGSASFDYCKYCYKDGEFVDKVSMEEYIEMCSKFGAQAGMTNEEMNAHCRKLFPMLKRWRGR